MTLTVAIGNGSWRPVSGVAPTITTTSLPSGVVGSPYSATIWAIGTTPFSWSIVSGSISPLTINSITGEITGTVSSSTTLTATFRASNGYSPAADKELSISFGQSAPVVLTAPTVSVWRYA